MSKFLAMVLVICLLSVNATLNFVSKTHSGYVLGGIDMFCAVVVLFIANSNLKDMFFQK